MNSFFFFSSAWDCGKSGIGFWGDGGVKEAIQSARGRIKTLLFYAFFYYEMES